MEHDQQSPVEAAPSTGARPLTGVRVIELCTFVMAPYACQILGDLGADVIKVEDAAGDLNRAMGGGTHPELSGIALNLHRNKRAIQLDLNRPEAMAAFTRLLDTADVFVTNLRPRALSKLGVDYDTVGMPRERLIYCEAHGFSLESGEADRPAFDDIIQAETGLPQLSGLVTGATSFLPTILADKVAGLTMVYAVLAALFQRTSTGLGQRVEIPMFDAVLSFNLVEHLSRLTVGTGTSGYNRILTHFRGPHRTKDGFVALLPYSDRHWAALYEAVGHGAQLTEECFGSYSARLENAATVYASLGRIMLERTTAEWLALAEELGIPAGPVPTIDEIVADPAHHRGVIKENEHPVIGPYLEIMPPARFSSSPGELRSSAPLLGQDTVSVLREVGIADDDIAHLVEIGAAIEGPGS